jgi:hypothetical protein
MNATNMMASAKSVFNELPNIVQDIAKKSLDSLSSLTGWRIVPEPLAHPDDPNVCTLDVPGYKQIESYTCGYVAGAMIMHTFHPRRSLERMIKLCAPDYETGVQTTTLVRALRASGIGVAVRENLTFADICKAIESGYPIVTLTKTPREDVVHWVVIYGYGKATNRLFIAGDDKWNFIGTLLGRKEVSWSDFQRSIWGQRGFGLICWGK